MTRMYLQFNIKTKIIVKVIKVIEVNQALGFIAYLMLLKINFKFKNKLILILYIQLY